MMLVAPALGQLLAAAWAAVVLTAVAPAPAAAPVASRLEIRSRYAGHRQEVAEL